MSNGNNRYYYTQLIGNPRKRPTLIGASEFSGIAMIDADPYFPLDNGNQW
jgi:hypothetical protein